MAGDADDTAFAVAFDADIHVRMEVTAWACEVRQLLARVLCLGSAASAPFCPEEVRRPSSRNSIIAETGGSTDPPVYVLTRLPKCPLLWTLNGGPDDVVLRYFGRHDVVVFPQVVATLAIAKRQVHSLDGLAFVRMDAVPPKLLTQPEATTKELRDILSCIHTLRRARETIKTTLQAIGPTAYAAFQQDLAAKYHKLALMYMNNFVKGTATVRKRCRDRITTRQTQFQSWFAHMSIDLPSTPSPPVAEEAPPDTFVIDLASSPTSEADPYLVPDTDAPASPPAAMDVRPPSPPRHSSSSEMEVDMEIDDPPDAVELVRRNPAKAPIIHWHVEKLVAACRVSNPDMPDARAVAEIMKDAMDYLMPLDCYSGFQVNKTMLAIEADLAKLTAVEIRRLVAPLALSPYLTSFFPTPLKKAVKLRSLNRRGCRVHFSDKLHHVKRFHFDDAPSAVQDAVVHVNNDNVREGGEMLPRRPSLPSQPFVDSRPLKYIRLG